MFVFTFHIVRSSIVFSIPDSFMGQTKVNINSRQHWSHMKHISVLYIFRGKGYGVILKEKKISNLFYDNIEIYESKLIKY